MWEALNNQIFLGDKSFVEKLQRQIKAEPGNLKEILKVQRRSAGKPLSFYIEAVYDTKEGIRKAYETGDYTTQQIADAFDVHYSTVSRVVKKGCP